MMNYGQIPMQPNRNEMMMQQGPMQPNQADGMNSGAVSVQEIDNQIAQHQSIIDQLVQLRDMVLGQALARRGQAQPGGYQLG